MPLLCCSFALHLSGGPCLTSTLSTALEAQQWLQRRCVELQRHLPSDLHMIVTFLLNLSCYLRELGQVLSHQ